MRVCVWTPVFCQVSSLAKFDDVFGIMRPCCCISMVFVIGLYTIPPITTCYMAYSKPCRESVNAFDSLWAAMLKHDPEKIMKNVRKQNNNKKIRRVNDVIGDGSIGCIVIINILMKFNGRLFTYGTFAPRFKCTHPAMSCMSSQTAVWNTLMAPGIVVLIKKMANEIFCLMPFHIKYS